MLLKKSKFKVKTILNHWHNRLERTIVSNPNWWNQFGGAGKIFTTVLFRNITY